MDDSMRVVVVPADSTGCGTYRMIWPAQALRAQGLDVTVRMPEQQQVVLTIKGDDVLDADAGEGTDVVVLQRVTHPFMARAIPLLRARGVAVVVDVDDDLSAIHPRNPAYMGMHPRVARHHDRMVGVNSRVRAYSWQHLKDACRDATLVTCSTPGLLPVYAAHGRGRVVPNCVPERYFTVEHTDSGTVSWPAGLASHPDDPGVVGGAVARLVADGARFTVTGPGAGCGAAFGLLADPPGEQVMDIMDWAGAVARIGVGIVPLADTRFNLAKSYLKGLELASTGVPFVASPRAEYRRLHALGAGVLADTPRRWYREVNRLRNDERARTDLAATGREAVRALTIEANAWRWYEVWEEALAIQRRTGPGTARRTGSPARFR